MWLVYIVYIDLRGQRKYLHLSLRKTDTLYKWRDERGYPNITANTDV